LTTRLFPDRADYAPVFHRSTSKYLSEQVQEGRANRQQCYLEQHQNEDEISELNSRIEELETQVERSGRTRVN
jgi:hypothetical protein